VRLLLSYARAELLELLRLLSFSVPTLLLPALFFVFFAVPRSPQLDNLLMASFAAFAVLGVAFFQFGVGIAAERVSPWQVYLRTLPASAATRLAAKLLAASVFAVASTGPVIALALALTSVELGATQWLRLVLALMVGSIPFGLLGLALGFWLSPKGALPVANVLFLGLAFLGGFWTGAEALPDALEAIGPVVPTRQWGEILWAAAQGVPWELGNWLGLTAFTVAFALLAAWGYRRDEGQLFT
jgi:ABC-2 type transport system permease protein